MRYCILFIALIQFSGCIRVESHGDLSPSTEIHPFGSEKKDISILDLLWEREVGASNTNIK